MIRLNRFKYILIALFLVGSLAPIQAQSLSDKDIVTDAHHYQYQSFPQFGFDISVPTPLVKNCSRTEGNYHQYCGFLFDDDPLKAESYHVVVMSFPEQIDVSSTESQELLFKALLKPYNAKYGKSVYGEDKHEVLVAYIDKDENGFPSQMGYFFKDNLMVCIVVQTHSDLQRRFDLVMNSLRFNDEPLSQIESPYDKPLNIYTGHKQIAYQIGYPYTFSLDDGIDNPFVDVTFTSSASSTKGEDRYFVTFQQNWDSLDALASHTISLIQSQQANAKIVHSGMYTAKAGSFKEYVLTYEEQGEPYRVSYYFTQLDTKTYMVIVFFNAEATFQRDQEGIYKVIQSIYVSKDLYIEGE